MVMSWISRIGWTVAILTFIAIMGAATYDVFFKVY